MTYRPDLPPGLNLSRRATTPVKLPKMSFPMLGGVPESSGVPVAETGEEGRTFMEENRSSRNVTTEVNAVMRENSRVIVYGRSGCDVCMAAIQDLVERQIGFTYHDVNRDERAMEHLHAICGGAPVVPVIVTIGSMG